MITHEKRTEASVLQSSLDYIERTLTPSNFLNLIKDLEDVTRGFISSAVGLNLGIRKGGLGDRILDWNFKVDRNGSRNSSKRSHWYALGYLAELASEAAVHVSLPIYAATRIDLPSIMENWYIEIPTTITAIGLGIFLGKKGLRETMVDQYGQDKAYRKNTGKELTASTQPI